MRKPRKSTAWYIKYPADVYAIGPVSFKTPVGVTAVRQWAKDWSKESSLPVGVACWPA